MTAIRLFRVFPCQGPAQEWAEVLPKALSQSGMHVRDVQSGEGDPFKVVQMCGQSQCIFFSDSSLTASGQSKRKLPRCDSSFTKRPFMRVINFEIFRKTVHETGSMNDWLKMLS